MQRFLSAVIVALIAIVAFIASEAHADYPVCMTIQNPPLGKVHHPIAGTEPVSELS